MATVRIQLRRGTSSQWDTANPTLAAGEIGIETDTNTFKFGDGTTAWNSLDYALSNTVDDYILLSEKGVANGVATLDGSGKVPYAQIPSIDELSQDAVNSALVAGTGITKVYNDGANTITVAVDTSVIATKAELAEVSQDSINDALVAGVGLDKTYDDVNNLITIDIDSTVATLTGTQTLTNKTLTSPVINTPTGIVKADVGLGNVDNTSDANKPVSTATQTALDLKAPLASPTLTGIPTAPTATAGENSTQIATTAYVETAVSNLVASAPAALNTLNELAAALGDDENFSTTVATSIGTKVSKSGDTMTGALTLYGNPQGALHAANKSYVDNLVTGTETTLTNALTGHNDTIYNVHGIADTSLLATKAYADNVGTVAGTALSNHNSDTTNVHGIADTSDLATGTALGAHIDDTTSVHGITNTANLVYTDDARLSNTRTPTNNTVSTDKIVALAVTTAKIDDLSVTSDKLAADSVTTAKIVDTSVTTDKLAGDSVTTAKIIDGAVTSAKIANDTIVDADINSSAAIAQSKIANLVTDLGSKSPSSSPTFTGTVTLPGTTSIGDVSSTEIGYLDGVTSAIQTQIDTKLASSTAASTYAPIDSPTFTGTVVLPSTTSIGTVSATELGYIDGVTSAIQTQIDSKLASATAASTYAPIASPTFTGTVSGVSKSMVGLGNVDNTADADKPVSTATQTALDAKLSLSGGTMTGALTLSGAPTQDAHAATKAYVDNVSAGINFHQPVRVATTGNITLSGTQTIDGVAVIAGDRVLVKDQTTQTQNGIYVVASGAWTRAADADNTPNGELSGGDFTLVLEGTVNSGYGYVCSNTSAITIGTTNVTYAAFNAAKAVTAGTGLTEAAPGTLEVDSSTVQYRVSGVSDTEIGYLDGVTSAIQTQLDAKAPTANPTFTGTVTVAASGVAFTDGTQTKEGVPSRTTVDSKTADYTLVLTDRDKMIEVNSSSSLTISIPTDASVNFPVGTSIDLLRVGSGAVTISAVTPATTTLNYTPGNKLRAQWSSATLFKRAANTWVLMGDLTA